MAKNYDVEHVLVELSLVNVIAITCVHGGRGSYGAARRQGPVGG